jgi:NADH-quinone oxidoreductase subunit J
MAPLQVIFILVAALVLGSAVMVVTTRNLVHSALWLVAALFGVAMVFVLLSAGFLAVAQVVIYIGAIAILFIFAVMLTRRLMQDTGPQTNRGWGFAALVSLLLFVGLVLVLQTWPGITGDAPALSPLSNPVADLGAALVSPDAYLIPFELASVLLLAALIGAIVVARDSE